MELQEFIKNTLISIKGGLREANEEFAKQDGKVLGKDATVEFVMWHDSGTSGKRNNAIDFDVAVTVNQTTDGKVGAGIKIAVVNIGSEIGTSGATEHASRIKFSIYPFHIIG